MTKVNRTLSVFILTALLVVSELYILAEQQYQPMHSGGDGGRAIQHGTRPSPAIGLSLTAKRIKKPFGFSKNTVGFLASQPKSRG